MRLNNSRKIGKCITIALMAISTLCCIGCQENTNNSIPSEYQMEAINEQNNNDINIEQDIENITTPTVDVIAIEVPTGKTISADEMLMIMKEQQKYRFEDIEEIIYATENLYLKDKPFVDAEDVIEVNKYDEITLLGLNEFDYWKVQYDDAVYYVDSTKTTREYSKIQEMKEEERREELQENFTKADLIIVGDSRMVGLDSSVSTDAKIIAKVSMGLKWLKNTAIYEIRNYADENSVIVLNLGINDLYNVNNYVNYYNEIKKEFPNNQVCFMSITPVDEAKEAQHGYSVTNENVRTFNQKMQNELIGIKYIDAYSFLMENGFSTGDGLHYNGSTYRTIYDYILDNLF